MQYNSVAEIIQENILLREKLDLITSYMQDYYFELDLDGRHITFRGSVDEYGLNPKDFIGKNHEEILGTEMAKVHKRKIRKALKGEKTIYEWSISSKKGEKKFFRTTLCPLRDKKGRVTGILGIGSDITDRILMSEAMIQEKKGEMLELLSAGVAHDFNNILTIIRGNCFLGKLNIKQRDHEKLTQIFDELEGACNRAKELTAQLQSFSKKSTLEKKTICIKKLIRETVEFSLTGSNVKCNYIFTDELSAVQCNESQMGQVFNNLAINAYQAMDDGGEIEITIKNIYKQHETNFLPKGEYVLISFKDNGKGIEKKDLDRIFQPYFSTKDKGNGLGLAMAHSIIKKHDGHIHVESNKKDGTKFNIYLPLCKKKIVNNGLVENIQYGNGRILVMEDDDNVRRLLCKMLNYLGYEVIATADSFDTINNYKIMQESDTKIDLVILDLTISGGEGAKKVIEKLKLIDSSVKAIVTSGYSKDQVIENYKEFGFKGAIYKPFKLVNLSKEVYKAISAKEEEGHGHKRDRKTSIY